MAFKKALPVVLFTVNKLTVAEMIEMKDINEAFDKVKDEEVRFRYIVDMASFKRIAD